MVSKPNEDLDLKVLWGISTPKVLFWLVCEQDSAAGMGGKQKFDSKPVAGELSPEEV